MRRILIMLSCLVMVSCASAGTKVSQATASEFAAGKATCREVRSRLGAPTIIEPSNVDPKKTVWIYAYSAGQAHPENLIPVVGLFAGGFDREQTVAAFRFTPDCVLDDTRYASLNLGAGVNLEGVSQSRKDTTEAQ